MKITIQTIPHNEQRYPTIGDWQTVVNGSELEMSISVSETKMQDVNFLVALHEMIECYLCFRRGVAQSSVDSFDMAFEAAKEQGEPGDCTDAPYYPEHQFAQAMECMMAQELGMNWHQYEDMLDEL